MDAEKKLGRAPEQVSAVVGYAGGRTTGERLRCSACSRHGAEDTESLYHVAPASLVPPLDRCCGGTLMQQCVGHRTWQHVLSCRVDVFSLLLVPAPAGPDGRVCLPACALSRCVELSSCI